MIASDRVTVSRWSHPLILGVILVIAAVLRFRGLDFGLPLTQARPDESRIINIAVRIAGGDLNPHYFVYPTLFMYVLAGVLKTMAIVRGVAVDALGPTSLHLAGRTIGALCGVATVWLVYALGRRLGGVTAGLCSALLLAVAFLHVRDSHFSTTDVPMTCLVAGSIALLLRDRRGLRDVAICGVVAGLAMSIKYNAALVAPVAIFLVLTDRAPLAGRARQLVVFLAAMAAGFLAGTPFAVVDRASFLGGISFVSNYLASGHVHDGQTFAVSNASGYYLFRILPAAVGWPILAAGLAGIVASVVRGWRTGTAFALFPVAYFITAARGETVFARYMIPIVPFLCTGAGYLVATIAGSVRLPRIAGFVGVVACVLLALPTASKSLTLDSLFARPDNRLVVGAWTDSHLRGSAVCVTGSEYGRFLVNGTPAAGCAAGIDSAPLPDYVVVQRSPLHIYSQIAPDFEGRLSADYVLVQSFATGLDALTEEDYDPADAFFIPLRRLDAIRRAGPAFEVYERRGGGAPRD